MHFLILQNKYIAENQKVAVAAFFNIDGGLGGGLSPLQLCISLPLCGKVDKPRPVWRAPSILRGLIDIQAHIFCFTLI